MIAYTERGANACVARPIVEEGEEESATWALWNEYYMRLDYVPWEVLWNPASSKAVRNALVLFIGTSIRKHIRGSSSRGDTEVCRRCAHRAHLTVSIHEADLALN